MCLEQVRLPPSVGLDAPHKLWLSLGQGPHQFRQRRLVLHAHSAVSFLERATTSHRTLAESRDELACRGSKELLKLLRALAQVFLYPPDWLVFNRPRIVPNFKAQQLVALSTCPFLCLCFSRIPVGSLSPSLPLRLFCWSPACTSPSRFERQRLCLCCGFSTDFSERAPLRMTFATYLVYAHFIPRHSACFAPPKHCSIGE